MTQVDVGRQQCATMVGVSSVADDDTRYCGRCGEPDDGGHVLCAEALLLEPPRYCTICRRRMVVQVMPSGWVATCSRHGEVAQTHMKEGPG